MRESLDDLAEGEGGRWAFWSIGFLHNTRLVDAAHHCRLHSGPVCLLALLCVLIKPKGVLERLPPSLDGGYVFSPGWLCRLNFAPHPFEGAPTASACWMTLCADEDTPSVTAFPSLLPTVRLSAGL